MKILVVDDERILADTWCDILLQSGFECEAAYSGDHALELARRNPPDILLTDVIMPGMNGISLAAAVRELWPRVRVLLVSGQSAASDLLAGADDDLRELELLPKPLPPDELIARLRRSRSS